MITINQARFFADLQLTKAYCEQELAYQERADWIMLRSIISPVSVGGKWYVNFPNNEANAVDWQPILWEDWPKKSDPHYSNSFVELFNNQLEFKRKVSGRLQYQGGYQGKILVVEYGKNIPDGATEPETGGFFDE